MCVCVCVCMCVCVQEHIYKLMKSDSYSRFIRSSSYQELLQAKKKVKKKMETDV